MFGWVLDETVPTRNETKTDTANFILVLSASDEL